MKSLIQKAHEARKKAYAPYSKFKVGATIETANGKVYTGCNIENVSLGATCCAERVALYKAVSDGHKSFKRIAIVADTKTPCPPCGICRQVLFEFSPNMEVIMVGKNGKIRSESLHLLLPNSFCSIKS